MKHVYELEVLFWEVNKTLKDQLYEFYQKKKKKKKVL